MFQKISVNVANIVSTCYPFLTSCMKQSYDVAAGISHFLSRCCDTFKYVFFDVAEIIFSCCNNMLLMLQQRVR